MTWKPIILLQYVVKKHNFYLLIILVFNVWHNVGLCDATLFSPNIDFFAWANGKESLCRLPH